MAQTSSAQHEPSMEEILASIRRIIEDGDPGRPIPPRSLSRASDEDAGPTSETTAVPAADNHNDLTRPAGEPSRLELRPAPCIQEESVSARLARQSDATQASRRPLDEVREAALSRLSVPPADEWKPEPQARTAPQVHGEPEEQIASIETSAEEELEAAISAELESPAPLADRETGQSILTASPAEHLEVKSASSIAVEPARSSIISDRAGRQVAAAFGELSEAFEASRRRSFDEIAEEMMRPMLQDWLDNNLPRLVEKLVREEIERIARGGLA